MGDFTKRSVEVVTRRIVTGIVEEVIEDAFAGGYDEQNEERKQSIRNMVEEALADIFEKRHSGTILVCNVHSLAQSTCFMDTLEQQAIVNTSFIMPNAAFVKKHVDWT